MHILLVDDHEKVRVNIYQALIEQGHTVTQADNGLCALSYFKKEQFDAIIADYKMPIMDGLKLCENILSEYDFSSDNIIVLSTEVNEHFKAKANKLKLEWLSKPIDIDVLLEKLAELSPSQAA
ncbi:response regulator [Catenovulum sp. SM1970]|uniref:response regulator n=1 Tax=Marinifaba aquimaris TaxID=2741323 RepID=UPI001574EC15|nr:response regulator [Marinifaba aquimaris]NTS75259.1 response regulator [Marinifaba aquimaris]